MLQFVMVGVGGACGALARYTLTGFVHRKFPDFLPLGTLVVNVLGCLVIGVLMELAHEEEYLSANARLLLVTGLLGSLTTFSAFGYETILLIAENKLPLAFLNVALNVIVGCAAVFAGYWLTKSLM